MLKIGLTGGIGCGKSTVAKYFAKLGACVIDSDNCVHELLKSKTIFYKKIIKHFGLEILKANGEIDHKKLREIIFINKHERIWLEKLLHPQVFRELKLRSKNTKAPYCILVIPLLFEVNATKEVDRVLVVDCPEKLRIQRVVRRDKVSAKSVKAIIKTQVDRKTRLLKADDVIANVNSLNYLKAVIKKLHQKYYQMALSNIL